MINKKMLTRECEKRGTTFSDIAEQLEIEESELLAKIEGTLEFTRGEIIAVARILSLTGADVDAVFFDALTAKTKGPARTENKPILSAAEAADYCGIGINTIRTWALLSKQGKQEFPCFWVGDCLKVPRQAFEEWLNDLGRSRVSLPSSAEKAPLTGRRRR